MGAPKSRYPHRHPDALGLLRLQLSEVQRLSLADGVWLPYGRDPAREVAHLVDEFPEERGRVDRIALAPDDWSAIVTEVFTRHGRVKVGLLPASLSRGVVLVRLHTSEVLRLRVTWSGALSGAPASSGAPGTVEGDWSP